MSFLRSTPGGLALTGWRAVAAVSLGFCLGPALAGAVGWTVLRQIGPDTFGEDFVRLGAGFVFATLSPLVTLPFWSTLAVAAALLMRRGWYGAGVAAILGALLGGLTGAILHEPVLMALGAVMATFHRFALALWRPMAF
ncbi:hypothetical protein [Neotabrizicola sp. VNH66]|uniref:hypothetical protein n=1 Tax=Neotabrizicola sp. VNH66 TaxID=3400918 RepID=UPI003C0F9DD8